MTSAVGGPITPAEVLSRAQYWTTHPPPNGYDQNGEAPDPDGKGYRADCSGYVSMCWHLSDSPNTSGIANGTAKSILKADLKAGDVMCAVAGGGASFGHVALFDHWVGVGQTSYYAHEFGSGASPKHHVIPYPYFPNDSRDFKPYRYPNCNGAAASSPETGDNSGGDTGSGVAGALGAAAIGQLLPLVALAGIIVIGFVIVMSQVKK